MKSLKNLMMAAVGVGALAFAQPASAATILTFGQTGGGSPITGTNNGAGTTTITASDVAVTITGIIEGAAVPVNALFTLNATSVGNATTVAGQVLQNFSGDFSIKSTNGLINYLSGSFVDAVFGAGASLTMSAAEPPGTLSFTSDVITAANLGLDRGMSLGFANVTPSASITNDSLSSFHSSVSGTFSANANQVPEPITLSLVGLGLAGVAARRRSKA